MQTAPHLVERGLPQPYFRQRETATQPRRLSGVHGKSGGRRGGAGIENGRRSRREQRPIFAAT